MTALLFAVVEAVEQGRNKTSTLQKMVWDAPLKKGQIVHEAKFAEDIKIVKVKQDTSFQDTEQPVWLTDLTMIHGHLHT